MDRLAGRPELLDGPLDDPGVLAGNLRDLRRANRWLGGIDLTERALHAIAPDDPALTVLDVGTGAVDIPLALIARWRARGLPARRIVAVDERPEILRAAAVTDGRVTSTPGLVLHVADGRRLPYPDRSFDVAHASMVIHHLEPADVPVLIGEMARVARLGVVVNDLARSRAVWLGAWLLSRLATANRLTRNDAPLSVRRAYTASEVVDALVAADLRVVTSIRDRLGHRWAVAAVRA